MWRKAFWKLKGDFVSKMLEALLRLIRYRNFNKTILLCKKFHSSFVSWTQVLCWTREKFLNKFESFHHLNSNENWKISNIPRWKQRTPLMLLLRHHTKPQAARTCIRGSLSYSEIFTKWIKIFFSRKNSFLSHAMMKMHLPTMLTVPAHDGLNVRFSCWQRGLFIRECLSIFDANIHIFECCRCSVNQRNLLSENINFKSSKSDDVEEH